MSEAASHQLACLEVWGGNRPLSEEIRLPGLSGWLHSRPYAGSAAGGDVYYVSLCSRGELARVGVADVAGHGDVVSRLATRLRELMQKHVNAWDQSQFVRDLNESFGKEVTGGKFATAVLVGLHAPSGQLVLTNGGHPPPLWFHNQTRRWELLSSACATCTDPLLDLPLGIIPGTDYHQSLVQLEPGDLLILYSDGLPEAKDRSGNLLTEPGLLKLAAELPTDSPAAAGRALLAAVAAYRSGLTPQDDETVVTLQRLAPPSEGLAA
ncbi:MAG: PP2C family protein-serine/threonine phosphatase [Candidatus Acidiferrales bacterium]